VFLPELAPWLMDFLEEISSFPAAPHDDMVDALTQALNHVRESNSYSSLSQFYLNETAVQTYHATGNFGLAAQQSGLSVREVEQLVAEADGDNEWTTAYEDETNRLQRGSTQSFTYGDRPSIATLTAQLLADMQRGK
jgi:hypothetical protein